jgi:hypothetical protein
MNKKIFLGITLIFSYSMIAMEHKVPAQSEFITLPAPFNELLPIIKQKYGIESLMKWRRVSKQFKNAIDTSYADVKDLLHNKKTRKLAISIINGRCPIVYLTSEIFTACGCLGYIKNPEELTAPLNTITRLVDLAMHYKQQNTIQHKDWIEIARQAIAHCGDKDCAIIHFINATYDAQVSYTEAKEKHDRLYEEFVNPLRTSPVYFKEKFSLSTGRW